MSVKFTREFFAEFQANPKEAFKKFGVDAESDSEFFKNDFKHMSFDEFEKAVKKSRFASFFDFAG